MNSRGERWCVLPLLVLVACAEPETAVPNRFVAAADLSPNVAGEGELLGSVYGSSGQKAANVWVKLVPAPGSQPSLLHGAPAAIEWADTASNRNFMFDWADPANTARCGTLAAYNGNNLNARQYEVHRPGPGQPAPSGKEMHCIRPGTYSISFSHNSDGSNPFWTQTVDYLQVPGYIGVSNLTAGLTEYVEYPEYSESASGLTDLNVDYTAASPASHVDTLDVENAGSGWDATTFTNNPAPSGTPADWFRFSVARTRSSWNGRGGYLARIYFDYDRDRTVSTHFFNSTSAGLTAIRPHRYYPPRSASLRAGLEVITPGQAAADVASTFRTIALNVCLNVENDTTWLATDQLIDLTCGLGSDRLYRFRPDAGSAWTTISTNPQYDFRGHSNAGPHLVGAQSINPTTHDTISYSRTVTAQSAQAQIFGRTYVTDKALNYYSSARVGAGALLGYWFVQYTDNPYWWAASGPYPQSGTTRIWPAGEYTVALRWEDSTSSLLKRARVNVVVCNPCGPLAPVAGGASATATEWSLFGGGPWLAFGSRLAPIVARFYALEGDHDVQSAFDSNQWFASDTGAASAPSLGAVLTFCAIPLRRPDARAVRFVLAPGSARRLSFGFALDPDIGPNAADDRSGFDAERNLAYVYDGESAVGYLLRDDATNPAIRAVRQYGIGRVPPRLPAASWDALHSTSVDLLPGARDVQLLLVSSVLISSDAGVTFITIRAGSVGELQSRADSVIVALRALH